MVSKAVLLAVTFTVGLLAPGPTVLRSVWHDGWAPQPAALLQVVRGSQPDCGLPRRELRFEMLPRDAVAPPPARDPSVCLAVYHPSADAARP
jgi:hypothetical protein